MLKHRNPQMPPKDGVRTKASFPGLRSVGTWEHVCHGRCAWMTRAGDRPLSSDASVIVDACAGLPTACGDSDPEGSGSRCLWAMAAVAGGLWRNRGAVTRREVSEAAHPRFMLLLGLLYRVMLMAHRPAPLDLLMPHAWLAAALIPDGIRWRLAPAPPNYDYESCAIMRKTSLNRTRLSLPDATGINPGRITA